MHISICDDHISNINDLDALIHSIYTPTSIHHFSHIKSFFKALEQGMPCDLVFMDIHWEQSSPTGIDFAETLYHTAPDTKLIYVTAQPDRFAQNIFLKSSNLKGFLIKPINTALLLTYLNKIEKECAQLQTSRLFLKNKGELYSLPTAHIKLLESEGHKVHIYTRDTTIITYEKLSTLSPQLPNHFLHCHKSYIINLEEVTKLENRRFLLQDGRSVPISKARYELTKKTFFSFLADNTL